MERRRGRERFVDTREDGREIHRARRVHFSRFHRFRFIINDPRHRGSRRVAVDAFTAREIDHSCSALGPFVRHCSMMSPVYAWEGGKEREGVGWSVWRDRFLRIGEKLGCLIPYWMRIGWNWNYLSIIHIILYEKTNSKSIQSNLFINFNPLFLPWNLKIFLKFR